MLKITSRVKLGVTIVLTSLLALAVLVPIAIRSLQATQQSFNLSPGDTLTVNCPTELRGRLRGTSSTVACLQKTAQPSPTGTAVLPTTTPAPPTATPGDTVPVAGQLCPAWVHDRYTVAGPDGKQYPTWHPPVDPEYGCLFGHEHGADPRTSRADPSLPAFGYAAALMGMEEPHVGFKVFVINQGDMVDDGRVAQADYRVVFHMGTSGVKRFTERFHSLEYDYVARDGTGREARVYGMADTSDNPIGSTCANPRGGGRDFSTIGCPDPYEIWPFGFDIIHPDDPFADVQHVRVHVGGAVAAFDPVTTVDPSDLTRLVFTQDYRRPGSGIDPRSPDAEFQGCRREVYGGPNYWNNAAGPTVYYTDPMGHVQPGPGPGLIRQEVSATASRANELYKLQRDFCGNGIRWPN
jgi:hypothetical protein